MAIVTRSIMAKVLPALLLMLAKEGSSFQLTPSVSSKTSSKVIPFQHQIKSRHPSFLQMVSTSPAPPTNANATATSEFDTKYPTQRGTTVDSRKIVAAGTGKKHLSAVRLSHILFLNEELASVSLNQLQNADITFDDLASQISNCAETRDHGGSIGWVSCAEGDGTNEHLDGFFPMEARNKVLETTTKVSLIHI